jgi:hypothetical protein
MDQMEVIHQYLLKGVEEIRKLQSSVDVCAQRLNHYNDLLNTHIRRTDLLEKRVDKVELPIKLLCYIGTPATVILALVEIAHRFHLI